MEVSYQGKKSLQGPPNLKKRQKEGVGFNDRMMLECQDKTIKQDKI